MNDWQLLPGRGKHFGEVLRVLRDEATEHGVSDVSYHVHFPGRNTLQVPEASLELVPSANSAPTAADTSAEPEEQTANDRPSIQPSIQGGNAA